MIWIFIIISIMSSGNSLSFLFSSNLPPNSREKKAHKFSGRRWSLEIQIPGNREMAQILFCQLFSMKKKVVGITFQIEIRLNLKNYHSIKNQASTIQKSWKFFVLSGINRTRPIQVSGKKRRKYGNMTSTTTQYNSHYERYQ